MLYIQYQMVKELRRRNLQRDFPERDTFLASLSECGFAQNVNSNELNLALGDMIGSDPREHFIDYREDHEGTRDRKRLAVTKKGRKFVRAFPFGFLEELTREYPYTLTHLAALAVGLMTAWLLGK